MIYVVNPTDLIQYISPSVFVDFLETAGWRPFPIKRTDIKVFQLVKSSGEAFQATIPLDKKLSDYEYALYDAVKTVVLAEEQPPEQFLLFLLKLSLQK